MGRNISLAAIEGDVGDTIANHLDLVESEEEATTLGEASGIEYRNTHYAIGRLRTFTLVTAPWVADHDALWKKLSKNGRVIAFNLSDNRPANCFYIYEGGKRVIMREEGGKGSWAPKHALERLANVKATDHKADFIRKVFARFTGAELTAEDVQAVTMSLHTRRQPQPAEEDLAEIVAAIARALAEPLPTTGAWVGLQWANRRNALDRLHEVWGIDPETAKTWVPTLLSEYERWPASERMLPRADFDRIVAGKATELDTLLAPARRRFRIRDSGSRLKFREKSFERFFTHPIASELEHLDLSHSDMPAEAAMVVARSERLANLVYLSFDRTHVGDDGIAALAEATHFGKLRRLNLYSCRMTSATLPALSRAAFAGQLEALAIGGNKLGVDIASLARFENLTWLSLCVDDTVETSAVAALLETRDLLPNLARLDLGNTAVIDAAPLAALRPGLVVHTEWVLLLAE